MSAPMLAGMPVVVSHLCVERPAAGVEARRIVRHGLADVLAWLGQDVGPRPDEPVPAVYVMGGHLVMHPEVRHRVMSAWGTAR
jgi:hypothetical protein